MANTKNTKNGKKQKTESSTSPLKKRKTNSVPKAQNRNTGTKSRMIAVKKVKPAGNNSSREKKIQEIKSKLLGQKESLLNGAEVALNELPGQAVFPDLGDQASAETDRNFMLRLREREQRLLKKIEEALDRIDNGVFGICDDCGEEIDIKRLDARPVTTMCIDCKTMQEEEEKLRES